MKGIINLPRQLWWIIEAIWDWICIVEVDSRPALNGLLEKLRNVIDKLHIALYARISQFFFYLYTISAHTLCTSSTFYAILIPLKYL